MNPEQRQLVKKLKRIDNELEHWQKSARESARELGYSWHDTRMYVSAIQDKIDEAIDYMVINF